MSFYLWGSAPRAEAELESKAAALRDMADSLFRTGAVQAAATVRAPPAAVTKIVQAWHMLRDLAQHFD